MNPGRLLVATQWVFLGYFVVLELIQLGLIVRAFGGIRRYLDEVASDPLESFFETSHYKPISLICPVYNEGPNVVGSVSSLLSLRYPEHQVVVVNDGSTDDTLEQLIQAYRLEPSRRVLRQLLKTQEVRGVYESSYVPNLVVVDKANGGKADALNCGINLARFPLVCCMDGDSLLEGEALLRIVRPFMDHPETVATGGVIRPLNGCKVTPMGIRGIHLPPRALGRFQVLEYLRSFLFGRMGLSEYGSLFVMAGAFAAFRRDVLVEAGGFSTETVGEDFEVILRIHRRMREKKRRYRVTLVPDPVCWTEVPENLGTLHRQRRRWQRGLWETLWTHRRLWFNPRYGRVGTFSLPFFLLFEALAPLVELVGYLLLAWAVWHRAVNLPYAVLFLWVALLMGIFNSMVAILLEELTSFHYQGLGAWASLLLTAVLENFGYRQLTVVWRLQGTWEFLRGKRSWGEKQRQGMSTAADLRLPSGPAER